MSPDEEKKEKKKKTEKQHTLKMRHLQGRGSLTSQEGTEKSFPKGVPQHCFRRPVRTIIRTVKRK